MLPTNIDIALMHDSLSGRGTTFIELHAGFGQANHAKLRLERTARRRGEAWVIFFRGNWCKRHHTVDVQSTEADVTVADAFFYGATDTALASKENRSPPQYLPAVRFLPGRAVTRTSEVLRATVCRPDRGARLARLHSGR
jgi:hypothetical protein